MRFTIEFSILVARHRENQARIAPQHGIKLRQVGTDNMFSTFADTAIVPPSETEADAS